MRFGNVRLLVNDFGKSWRFYHETLGLTPAKGHGQPPYGEFVWGNRAMLGIFERGLMAKAVGLKPGRYAQSSVGRSALILEADDVDAVARSLRQRKVRLLAGPADRPVWGIRTVHFRDPDGYLVEVYSRLKRPRAT
jgi:lactoylglutathione lyase